MLTAQEIVNRIYKALRDREKNFQRKTYANHGIVAPKMTPDIKRELGVKFPFLQIITNEQWERQWRLVKERLRRKLDLKRDVVWMVQTKGGGASSQNKGHLPRSQAWMFGKLAQSFPKPTYIIADDIFPIKDKAQVIISDDASYSGSQLGAVIYSIGDILYEVAEYYAQTSYGKKFSVDFYIAIPFLHIFAWERVKEEVANVVKKKDAGVVSSTDRKVIGKNRFFQLTFHALGRIIHDTHRGNPAFILEHKVADQASLGKVSDKIRKIYDPTPIYKKDTIVHIPKVAKNRLNREFLIGRPMRKQKGGGSSGMKQFALL